MLYIRPWCLPILHYNSLLLLTPTSHSFLPSSFFPLKPLYLFSMSMSLLLFHRWVHLCHILDSTYNDILRCLSFSFWLTSLSMIVSSCIHAAADDITISPLHTNLHVVNFQRCEHVFRQCQVWVKLQLALHLPLLMILQLYHLPPPLVSNSSCLFSQ